MPHEHTMMNLYATVAVFLLVLERGAQSKGVVTSLEVELQAWENPCEHPSVLQNDGRSENAELFESKTALEEEPCTETDMEIDSTNSWSPVKNVQIYCPQRSPKNRIDRRCAYRYCVDPATKKMNYNVITTEIKSEVNDCIQIPGRGAYQRKRKINVGCTCIFPTMTS